MKISKNLTEKRKKRLIILKSNRGFYRSINISTQTVLRWKKLKIDVSILREASFPSYYIVKDKQLVPYNESCIEANCERIIGSVRNEEILENNMQIIKTQENVQKLDSKVIGELRKRGHGEAIVDTIANNNVNFEKRTQFSKEKYKERKKKKYMLVLRAEEVSMKSVNGRKLDICNGLDSSLSI